MDQPLVFGIRLLGRAALTARVLVAALVPLDPVGQEAFGPVDVDERADGEDHGQTHRGADGEQPWCRRSPPAGGAGEVCAEVVAAVAARVEPRRAASRQPGRAEDEFGDAEAHEQEHAQVPEGQHPEVPCGGGLDACPDPEQQPGHRGEGDEHERRGSPPDDPADDRDRDQRGSTPLPGQRALHAEEVGPREQVAAVLGDGAVAHVGRVLERRDERDAPHRGE